MEDKEKKQGEPLKLESLIAPIGNWIDDRTDEEFARDMLAYRKKEIGRFFKKNLRKITPYVVFGVLGYLIAGGISKCQDTIIREEAYFANPTNVVKRIDKGPVGIEAYIDRYLHSNQWQIMDVDSNGTADAIISPFGAEFYTPEYENYSKGENLKESIKMNPQLRELATKHLNSGKNLSKAIYEAQHNIKLH